MSNLARFEFDGHVVEAFTDNSKRDWFRGTQVCKVLGFGNSSVSINRHAQEYSREWKIGEGRPSLYVSEPGLYALIFASRTDSADKFKKWIFEEVLPALRKEGAYISPNISLEQLDRLDQNSKRLRALRLDARVKWTDVIKRKIEEEEKGSGYVCQDHEKRSLYAQYTTWVNQKLFGQPNFSNNRDTMTEEQQQTISRFEQCIVALDILKPDSTIEKLISGTYLFLGKSPD